MKVVVTGADGFLGRHLRAYLFTRPAIQTVALAREHFTPSILASAVQDADVVIHLAGINRDSEDVVEQGNAELAVMLADALRTRPDGASPCAVAYAGTIHADTDTPYGRGKRRAGEVLAQWADATGNRCVEVRLPGLFGEHGRPHYNSFVATFAHLIAHGEEPEVTGDRQIPLLHVHQAVRALCDTARGGVHPCDTALSPVDPAWRSALKLHDTDDPSNPLQGPFGVVTPPATMLGISEVRDRLVHFRDVYTGTGHIPALRTPTDIALFNTLRAAMWPHGTPIRPTRHSDERGALHETIRVHDGPGQSFISSTNPGYTRGNHFHFAKIERFHVLRGTAMIRLRHVLTSEVMEFPVNGDDPCFIDMPTLWTHSIQNVGDDELITMFWTNELFDPECPDTWADPVIPEAASSAPSRDGRVTLGVPA